MARATVPWVVSLGDVGDPITCSTTACGTLTAVWTRDGHVLIAAPTIVLASLPVKRLLGDRGGDATAWGALVWQPFRQGPFEQGGVARGYTLAVVRGDGVALVDVGVPRSTPRAHHPPTTRPNTAGSSWWSWLGGGSSEAGERALPLAARGGEGDDDDDMPPPTWAGAVATPPRWPLLQPAQLAMVGAVVDTESTAAFVSKFPVHTRGVFFLPPDSSTFVTAACGLPAGLMLGDSSGVVLHLPWDAMPPASARRDRDGVLRVHLLHVARAMLQLNTDPDAAEAAVRPPVTPTDDDGSEAARPAPGVPVAHLTAAYGSEQWVVATMETGEVVSFALVGDDRMGAAVVDVDSVTPIVLPAVRSRPVHADPAAEDHAEVASPAAGDVPRATHACLTPLEWGQADPATVNAALPQWLLACAMDDGSVSAFAGTAGGGVASDGGWGRSKPLWQMAGRWKPDGAGSSTRGGEGDPVHGAVDLAWRCTALHSVSGWPALDAVAASGRFELAVMDSRRHVHLFQLHLLRRLLVRGATLPRARARLPPVTTGAATPFPRPMMSWVRAGGQLVCAGGLPGTEPASGRVVTSSSAKRRAGAGRDVVMARLFTLPTVGVAEDGRPDGGLVVEDVAGDGGDAVAGQLTVWRWWTVGQQLGGASDAALAVGETDLAVWSAWCDDALGTTTTAPNGSGDGGHEGGLKATLTQPQRPEGWQWRTFHCHPDYALPNGPMRCVASTPDGTGADVGVVAVAGRRGVAVWLPHKGTWRMMPSATQEQRCIVHAAVWLTPKRLLLVRSHDPTAVSAADAAVSGRGHPSTLPSRADAALAAVTLAVQPISSLDVAASQAVTALHLPILADVPGCRVRVVAAAHRRLHVHAAGRRGWMHVVVVVFRIWPAHRHVAAVYRWAPPAGAATEAAEAVVRVEEWRASSTVITRAAMESPTSIATATAPVSPSGGDGAADAEFGGWTAEGGVMWSAPATRGPAGSAPAASALHLVGTVQLPSSTLLGGDAAFYTSLAIVDAWVAVPADVRPQSGNLHLIPRLAVGTLHGSCLLLTPHKAEMQVVACGTRVDGTRIPPPTPTTLLSVDAVVGAQLRDWCPRSPPTALAESELGVVLLRAGAATHVLVSHGPATPHAPSRLTLVTHPDSLATAIPASATAVWLGASTACGMSWLVHDCAAAAGVMDSLHPRHPDGALTAVTTVPAVLSALLACGETEQAQVWLSALASYDRAVAVAACCAALHAAVITSAAAAREGRGGHDTHATATVSSTRAIGDGRASPTGLAVDGCVITTAHCLSPVATATLQTMAAALAAYLDTSRIPLYTITPPAGAVVRAAPPSLPAPPQPPLPARKPTAAAGQPGGGHSVLQLAAVLRTCGLLHEVVALVGRSVEEGELPSLFPAVGTPRHLFADCVTAAKHLAATPSGGLVHTAASLPPLKHAASLLILCQEWAWRDVAPLTDRKARSDRVRAVVDDSVQDAVKLLHACGVPAAIAAQLATDATLTDDGAAAAAAAVWHTVSDGSEAVVATLQELAESVHAYCGKLRAASSEVLSPLSEVQLAPPPVTPPASRSRLPSDGGGTDSGALSADGSGRARLPAATTEPPPSALLSPPPSSSSWSLFGFVAGMLGYGGNGQQDPALTAAADPVIALLRSIVVPCLVEVRTTLKRHAGGGFGVVVAAFDLDEWVRVRCPALPAVAASTRALSTSPPTSNPTAASNEEDVAAVHDAAAGLLAVQRAWLRAQVVDSASMVTEVSPSLTVLSSNVVSGAAPTSPLTSAGAGGGAADSSHQTASGGRSGGGDARSGGAPLQAGDVLTGVNDTPFACMPVEAAVSALVSAPHTSTFRALRVVHVPLLHLLALLLMRGAV